MWKRRLLETFAIVTIGDGAIEVLAPRGHSLLWDAGPEGGRRVTCHFAENPNRMRLLGAVQVANGIRIAFKQYED